MIRAAMQLALWLIVVTAVFIVAGAGIIYVARMHGPVQPDAYHAFSQAEFITIILAAVTVVLTALAIVLALAGAVGYVAIRAATLAAADMAAREVAEKVAREVAPAVAAREAAQQAALLSRGSDPSAFAAAASGDEGAGPPTV